ncbi:uncharacterized protein LOC110843774 isoform X2 [Folsomia candida]|nr:uncharacterized protein LOC110843774 isoform X2 [Folsomia candida]
MSLKLLVLFWICLTPAFGDQFLNELRADTWADRLASFPSQILQSAVGTFSNSSGVPSGCGKPPNFPLGITLLSSDFLNWSELLNMRSLWAAEPETPEDVVTLANWAYKHGYSLRPRGYSHSWAPLTVTPASQCSRTLIVDTTKHLTAMRMLTNSSGLHAPINVLTQTGASWEDLLNYLESKNLGIFSFPAVGKMTIGGTLAVGAHGTGFPTRAAKLDTGFRTGDAVVWDYKKNEYALRTFTRLQDEDMRAFLVHLGRAFITQVSLMVGPNYNLRCQSITNIRADALFSRDHDNENALANFVENYDRVEAQFFPYTDRTWLKLWTEEKVKSGNALTIDKPYPYTHGRQVFRPADRLISLLASGITRLTPVISRMTYEIGVSGVALTRTADVWGPSKNSLLYYHHLAHKFVSLGYNVVTSRANIQKVVNLCYLFYSRLSDEMATKGMWPMNQPLEFRITGLDKVEVMEINSTKTTIKPPALSFLSEIEGHPEYDVAVFFGLHYFPGTPNTATFMKAWESFLFTNFNGGYATARVEWAKTWGFDDDNSWVNSTVFNQILPATYGSEWNWAMAKLDEYDPHNIYSNEFLQKLTLPLH